ncbi:MAG: hypothetical protein ACTSRU_14230 [Candidatus Hodarchaeales archaeon]
MGEIIGRCKRCGRLMRAPHPSGLCIECRKRRDDDRGTYPGPLRMND